MIDDFLTHFMNELTKHDAIKKVFVRPDTNPTQHDSLPLLQTIQ